MSDTFTDESLPDPKEELKAMLTKVGEVFGVSADEVHDRLVAGGLVLTAGRKDGGRVKCHLLRIPPELRKQQHK